MKNLIYDWKFMKGEVNDAEKVSFDDSNWRTVRVPHDYAIEGPFSLENDKQIQEVIADGIEEPIVHTGRTGGLPICDHAWYRKTFYVESIAKKVFLEFDGVMSHSNIYVNGIHCGGRIYGYSSFCIDISEACVRGEDNLLAVSVQPEHTASRWYSGAGIYRNVRLVEKGNSYFPYQPAYIISKEEQDGVTISCELDVVCEEKNSCIELTIFDQEGVGVVSEKVEINQKKVNHKFFLETYNRWNVLDSYLYKMEAKLLVNNKEVDCNEIKFGIRTLQFDANKGLFVNGIYTKLKGVCLHHDAGALGAAVNKSVICRQLKKLMSIGVNAVRCTHNPPAVELLDLCDEFGLVVIDEAYDEWQIKKVENGYGKYFDTCGEEDLVSMIRRDRNHPCIIMWSIGNEILEQDRKDGWKIARKLHEICHREDDTRPTTAGFSMTVQAFENGLCDEVDIVGVNYKPHLYETFHQKYPNAILYGSETASTISSRGEYYLPVVTTNNPVIRDNYQVSSYDLESPPWAYYAEKEFKVQDEFDYLLGEFVWTGFDYLGEPTPYREEWPSRSSYFGIFDLAGMEKDRSYSYKSRWTDEKVLHIFPHWNWQEGDIVEVHAYSSFDEVELFLNGKSLGISKKNLNDELLRHRHIWKDIAYVPGEIKAVAVADQTIVDVRKTAGEARKIVVEPERKMLCADGEDVVYIACSIVDEDGNLCPNDTSKMEFEVVGAGEYLAADSGDATDIRTFSEPFCHVFHGKCMVIVRSIYGRTGDLELHVKVEGMDEVVAYIKVK
ncbi:MAG: glycoside hydrolase family 2 TIM barrel-domain containing protein [Eubacteriales bacterium]